MMKLMFRSFENDELQVLDLSVGWINSCTYSCFQFTGTSKAYGNSRPALDG